MLAQDHLTLRLIRLKSTEEWTHKREGLSFVFPKGGGGKYSAEHIVQRLAPGEVLVLSEGGGKLCASNGGEMVFWCFSICLEHLFPLFAGNEIALLQEVKDSLKTLKLYPASSALAIECHRLVSNAPPQFDLDHRGQLLRVAAAILTQEFKIQRQRVGFVRVEEHMIQVFEKLSAAELLSLSVGDLADRFGCSRRHLNRLFHKYFHFSVAALRMEMRLIKAVSLLRDPDAKVINVAEQCGFNHLGLFNTCFKRRFGTSPGRWRKFISQTQTEQQPTVLLDSDSACVLRAKGLCPWTDKSPGCDLTGPKAPRSPKAGATRILGDAQTLDEAIEEEALAIHQNISGEICERSRFQVRS